MKNAIAYLRARPALVGTLVSTAGTLAAAFGLNLDPAQFTAIVTMLNVLVGASVHVSTGPKAPKAVAHEPEHEKP